MPTPNLVIRFAGLNVYVDDGKGCLKVLMLEGGHGEMHTPRLTFNERNFLGNCVPSHHTIETPDRNAWGVWDFRGVVAIWPGRKPPSCNDHQCGDLRVPLPGEIVAGSGTISEENLEEPLPPNLVARVDVRTGDSKGDAAMQKLEFIDPSTKPPTVVKEAQDYAARVETIIPLKKDGDGRWSVTFRGSGYALDLFTDSELQDLNVAVTNLPEFPERDHHFAALWDLAETQPGIRPIPRVPGPGGGDAGCVGGQYLLETDD